MDVHQILWLHRVFLMNVVSIYLFFTSPVLRESASEGGTLCVTSAQNPSPTMIDMIYLSLLAHGPQTFLLGR